MNLRNPLRLNTWLCPQVNDMGIPLECVAIAPDSDADAMETVLVNHILLARVRDMVNARQSGVN